MLQTVQIKVDFPYILYLPLAGPDGIIWFTLRLRLWTQQMERVYHRDSQQHILLSCDMPDVNSIRSLTHTLWHSPIFPNHALTSQCCLSSSGSYLGLSKSLTLSATWFPQSHARSPNSIQWVLCWPDMWMKLLLKQRINQSTITKEPLCPEDFLALSHCLAPLFHIVQLKKETLGEPQAQRLSPCCREPWPFAGCHPALSSFSSFLTLTIIKAEKA